LLAAGGTGGHLFPAEALAIALDKRGIAVELATDHRAAHYKFPARVMHIIPSATLRGRGPDIAGKDRDAAVFRQRQSMAAAWPDRAQGRGRLWRLSNRPAAACGKAGAKYRRCCTEQNGVMGRANAFLASRVTAIATGIPLAQELSTGTGRVK
jgi:UDP-N-acetylglucosamine--N-acetylmuramyl-(pentapeptide) pyrophosphoryl-undecaprenol N-acetylglucosamine transferase